MSKGPLNLLVFREDSKCVSGPQLKADLHDSLDSSSAQGGSLSALLLAGELECAIADAAPQHLPDFESLTDALARAVVGDDLSIDPNSLKRQLLQLPVPPELRIAKFEGFAYYALHPLGYAEVLQKVPSLSETVMVLGIRSIGATLSAVTAAAARRAGHNERRTTVRPEGHPYYRETRFSPQQLESITETAAKNGSFLIVDEGPGLSGSSFLSVAEALVAAGAPRESISIICGHEPDLESLQTTSGPERASQFRWLAVNNDCRRPQQAELWVGGGEWRKLTRFEEEDWPASWVNFERLKYLSAPGTPNCRLFKFAGFGHYGQEIAAREQQLVEAGFGPPPLLEPEGYIAYPWITGRPMRADDLAPPVLERIAEYCAFRSKAFPAKVSDLRHLQQMAEHNLDELKLEAEPALRLERPVISDGRMQPHEWLFTPDGDMLKTDSGSHGDDHFFPGPTDIAWDLAGAIVEWQMSDAAAEVFLEMYHQESGDDASSRIQDFITAYSVFRCAYCMMAGNAVHDTAERGRLERAAAYYRKVLEAGCSPLLSASGF